MAAMTQDKAAVEQAHVAEELVLDNVDGLRAAVQEACKKYEAEVGHKLPADLVSDVRMARFLSAHAQDEGKAASAYEQMLAWRKEMEIEALRKKHLEEVEILQQSSFPHWKEIREAGEYGPWYVAGKSHAGDLVHLEVIGASDPSFLLTQVSDRMVLEHYIGFFETRAKILDSLSAETNRMVRTVQIRDLSKFGVSLVQHASAMKVLSAVMKAGSAYYPESSSKVIFVNTPMSFYGVWKMASMALRQRTLDKVTFLQSRYHRELLKYVEPRVIHRLEKMKSIDNHDFIEKGEEEDHLPLEISATVSVAAGKTDYYPLWMTRSGPRSKAVIEVSVPSGSAAGTEPPSAELIFCSNAEGHKVEETKLPGAAYATGVPGRYEVTFPEMLPDTVQDAYLLVTFDNTASWMMSLSVPLKVSFTGEAAA
ncbi:SEC14 cytosolic factor [Hondaea fermentalgiana]|uniref:SEC14 cytosolic factor n=1 Tax=Hondaea fermentalgiana TaxID=2315210 RepID=A0A2R5GP54_9STRA|nr:SEC14 cytosolic factor [Hondaea fermentalgiana]|eukprot:GBG31558.1 SEC14 cytosolic factor [Hondaea fermentalgiana]